MDLSRYRVLPKSSVDLAAWPTSENDGLNRADAEEQTEILTARLEVLQEVLYAEGRHKVLIVLQATDAGGKDGTIRHVFDKVNPQGVNVASFKRPTEEELDHDFLWRVHANAPRSGELRIFNRSHYEDVLAVRVHNIVPESRWSRRYDHINAFERLLADEGTTIIKLFLHVSKDQQRERLQARLDDPRRHWKFDRADLVERLHWDSYQEAYRVMLERTSTDAAPWHVIPADRKWFRNLLVSEIVVEALEGLEMGWPAAEDGLEGITLD